MTQEDSSYDNLSDVRRDGETFPAYRARLKLAKMIINNYLKGRPKNNIEQGEEIIESYNK